MYSHRDEDSWKRVEAGRRVIRLHMEAFDPVDPRYGHMPGFVVLAAKLAREQAESVLDECEALVEGSSGPDLRLTARGLRKQARELDDLLAIVIADFAARAAQTESPC